MWWAIGYVVVGIAAGIGAHLWMNRTMYEDADVSYLMMLGAVILFWPMFVPLICIIGLGKIAQLLGRMFEGKK